MENERITHLLLTIIAVSLLALCFSNFTQSPASTQGADMQNPLYFKLVYDSKTNSPRGELEIVSSDQPLPVMVWKPAEWLELEDSQSDSSQ